MKFKHCGLRGVLLLVLSLISLNSKADKVDDYIKTRMAREHIPGLSLVVIHDGKIVKAKGYGYASLEHNVPARLETVYDLASTTKPFTATAILLLIQDGKLSLADKISKFVENSPDAWKEITVRHLLSHTSGIHNYVGEPPRKDFPNDTPAEEIAKWARELPLDFAPGTKWSYSNTGYVLLGLIVQRVSGRAYGDFLRERVFLPLGMTNTGRILPDELISHRAGGYLWFGGGFHNADFLKYMMTNHGDRGLRSTVLDLAKWEAALAASSLFTSATREAMWTPVIKFDGGYSDEFEYGLGWFLRRINGHRQISHPGGSPGTAAIFSRYPDDNLTVILLANGGRAFPQALDLGVARHYIPGLFPNKIIELRPAQLEACAGYYNAYGFQVLKVERDQSGLFIDDGGGVNNEFLPVSDTKFVAEEADRGFTVIKDAQGVVTGASLRFGRGEAALQRIGGLARSLKPQPDPEPARTHRIAAILRAFEKGGKAVEGIVGLAPQARKDYAQGPSPEFAGIQSIKFIASQDVSGRGIERHGAKVSRVIYYKLNTEKSSRYVLVYLTADDLVTDQDVVTE